MDIDAATEFAAVMRAATDGQYDPHDRVERKPLCTGG
jgi:hypothetical protein